MNEPTVLLVQCSQCQAIFDLEIILNTTSKNGESSKVEKECPKCPAFLQFEIPGGIAEDVTVLKGIPKSTS